MLDCEQSTFFFRFQGGVLAPVSVSRAFCSTDQEKRETARSLRKCNINGETLNLMFLCIGNNFQPYHFKMVSAVPVITSFCVAVSLNTNKETRQLRRLVYSVPDCEKLCETKKKQHYEINNRTQNQTSRLITTAFNIEIV